MRIQFIMTLAFLTATSAFAQVVDYTVGCRVFAMPESTVHTDLDKSIVFETERITQVNASQKLEIRLKNKLGEDRIFSLQVQKNILGPNKFNNFKTVGATYSFNNPFDSGSFFKRNDLTGATSLKGGGFTHENLSGILTAKMFGPKNTSSVSPYIMVGLLDPKFVGKIDTTNSREKLYLMPDGQEINGLLVLCNLLN
jgi:hypothetical protein